MRRLLPMALLLAAPAAAQQIDPAAAAVAQSVREEITPDGLRRHARAIVRHPRPSGSPGENAAIDHIVAALRADGVPVEVHTFQAYASDPVSARVEVVGGDFAPEAITASFSASVEGLEAPLVDVGALRDLPELEVGTGEVLRLAPGAGAGLPDVRGRIALVTGQPRNVPTTVLQLLGAAAVVYVNPEERLNDLIVTSTWGTPSLRSAHRLETLPVAQVRAGDGARLREMLRAGAVRLRVSTRVETGWKPLRLAVATILPADSAAPFALLGGHIDAWHHGATDEGASNAAMVELARAFHRRRDRLRRGLVVAWWPGHSNARYAGSTWYADHFYELLRDRAVAYLNVDGIGQTGAHQLGANSTRSLDPLARVVVRDREGVEIRPTRPGRNSDQSFNGIGLPLLQLNRTRGDFDGGYWWWHTPDDTFDKIDFDVLERDTELYTDALAALLVSPRMPIDAGGEVTELRDELERWQQRAGAGFDLGPLLDRANALHGFFDHHLRVDSSPGDPVRALRVLRPLHRVVYTASDPFHPDPGVEGGLLPGLLPIEVLATEPPESDRYRFAEASLVRERNRIAEALDLALAEAQAMLNRNPR